MDCYSWPGEDQTLSSLILYLFSLVGHQTFTSHPRLWTVGRWVTVMCREENIWGGSSCMQHFLRHHPKSQSPLVSPYIVTAGVAATNSVFLWLHKLGGVQAINAGSRLFLSVYDRRGTGVLTSFGMYLLPIPALTAPSCHFCGIIWIYCSTYLEAPTVPRYT